MNFLKDTIQLLHLSEAATAILVLSLTIVLGLAFGKINFRGVRFGVAGVMFSGLLLGHFKINFSPELAEFIREFGLMLFVYTIGVEVGPAFFSSLRKEGAKLNLIAFILVSSGALITFALAKYFDIPAAAAGGLFSGSVTNTPSLAAGQQLLKGLEGVTEEMLKMPGLGYAVAYPFGILGVIITFVTLRLFCRIDPSTEAENYQALHIKENPRLETVDLKIENSDLDGMRIREILPFRDVIISRVVHDGKVRVALPKTAIHTGDMIRVVGTKPQLEALCFAIGAQTNFEKHADSSVQMRRMVVTKTELSGKLISELDAQQYGVTITRVRRGDLEFPGTGNVKIAFGDILSVVGNEDDLKKFRGVLGDHPKILDHPHLIPAFVCLALGVLLGSLPLQIPGIPAPLKIGLAGGVLIAALLLSYIGKIGPLVWYLPASGSLMLREIGIALFLACVGLRSGDKLVETFSSGPGLLWLGCGVTITIVPLMLTAFFLRLKLKMNYLSLCGLLSGCYTSPSTLAYANQMAASSAPVVSYAAVYPLVMILRVIAAELLILFLIK